MRGNWGSVHHIRRAAVVGLALIVMLTGGCSQGTQERPELLEPRNANLDMAQVERGTLGSIKLYDAIVEPDIEEIGFGREGYIYGVYVSPGEEIEEGDVIASMVGHDFSKIQDLEDKLEELRKEYDDHFTMKEADIEINRLRGLDVREAELELSHERELYDLAIRQLEERLEKLKSTDQGYTYIEAPRDCRVLASASLREGTYIDADTVICAVEGEGRPRITCTYMSEKRVNDLVEYYAIVHGRRCELRYIPYSKQELTELATAGISPRSVFEIVDEDIDDICVGDYALIVTVPERVEGTLIVPINAVFFDSEGKYVYEVVDNEKTKRYVKTGISDDINIEITDGIGEGAYVYVKN